MQYLLTIYIDESAVDAVPPEQGVKVTEAYEALTAELKQAGVFLGGEGLQRTSTATTVRVRDGEPLLTDGPFAETREQLAGFYLLECADLDEAVRWASKVPSAAMGSVEVRPVITYDDRVARAQAGGAAAHA
jgi:hypothetical protein